jgi:hypothetical protein
MILEDLKAAVERLRSPKSASERQAASSDPEFDGADAAATTNG